MPSSQKTKIHIGLIGLGVVGQGVWKHLQKHKADLGRRLGVDLVLKKAAVKDPARERSVQLTEAQLTNDPMAVATDPEIRIVCELMGGTGVARTAVLAALNAGKTVVTANKALLCDHGAELFAAARAGGGQIFFEASVAGGIPIIKVLREGLVANRFSTICGILNGTCNYILTRMERERQGFEAILGDARKLGYVEADESLDLDGWDTAHKTAILAWLAHGRWISTEEMAVEGIREVTLHDIEWARELGFKIKLLAVIQRDTSSGRIFASVQPTLVPRSFVLANVDEVFNGVSITGDVVGTTVYIGRGAGQDATASSVISDIVDAALDLRNGACQSPLPSDSAVQLLTLEEIRNCYYIRLEVKDKPGVLAEVATLFAQKDISIESVLQTPTKDKRSAHLILTTHVTTEKRMADALQEIAKAKWNQAKPFRLPIAQFKV